MKKKFAFTLAELLVALVIVGVISVMVLPSILQKIERRKVETALPKFYTTMNTALRMSKANDGACNYAGLDIYHRPKEWGKGALSYDNNLEVLNNCFLPNLKYSKVEPCDEGTGAACVYFMNGEHFSLYADANGGYLRYCIYSAPEKCKMGKTAFMFEYLRLTTGYQWTSRVRSTTEILPFLFNLTGDSVSEMYGINHLNESRACSNNGNKYWCTYLLKANNWKFPKNYPTKF